MSVSAVTFANGGDNIGIYTPLFATSDAARLLVILGVFYVLLAVWCYVGYVISRHPLVARVLARYSHIIVPFVLIGLGIYIIVESGTGLGHREAVKRIETAASASLILSEILHD